jgi:Sulfotransferase domain
VPWPLSHRNYVFVTSPLLGEYSANSPETHPALHTGLNILGYQSYHYLETRNNKKHKHIRCWLEALNAKLYGIGKPYGRAEFDKVLAKYSVIGQSFSLLRHSLCRLTDSFSHQAVTDAPCANLAEELLKAYPNAKVILNTRDVEKWLPSMEASYYDILAWRPLQMLAAVDTVRIFACRLSFLLLSRFLAGGSVHIQNVWRVICGARRWDEALFSCLKTYFYNQKGMGPHLALLRLILTDWTSGDWENRTKLREGFVKHYEHIRSLVPEDNLLEHRSQDGWEPLCKFLGKPIPDEAYPCVNQGDSAAQIHTTIFWVILSKLVMTYVAPVLLAAYALSYLRWRQT